ncbi:hypothetical protein KOW79_003661 [Hemibagrus wyckioides]|uniref:Uncharacterized protein n=1 Tax=Hemibagrus wyckioides TaxID=337641 RepID=A0A9D3P3S6_9TELE|nr:hypothetical protein KOW79_003661 [Hemibagrus wyckioides]
MLMGIPLCMERQSGCIRVSEETELCPEDCVLLNKSEYFSEPENKLHYGSMNDSEMTGEAILFPAATFWRIFTCT